MKDQPESEDYRDPYQYNYHYDREDRISRLSPRSREGIMGTGPKGIFRKNRTLAVILIDIMIIAVVWFIFLPLVRTGASGRLGGYSFALHSFSYNGNAYITLKVAKEEEKAESQPSYTAIFGLSSSDRSLEMQGLLPKKLHESLNIRTSLPLPGKTASVVCTVQLGGKKLSLKARLRPES